jgi:hypothetical protein
MAILVLNHRTMDQNTRGLRVKNKVIPIGNEDEVSETVNNNSPLVLLDNTR